MSNTPTTIEARPQYLQQYFGNRSDTEFEVPGGQPIAVLKPRNNIWRVGFAGNTIDIEDENRRPRSHLDVVFVGAHASISKVFFLKDWGDDNTARPDCASSNNDRPDPGVPAPQSEFCHSCRWNQFGTAKMGKGKACKDHLRVAVLPVAGDPMQGGRVIANEAFNGPMLFRVMPGSFANFSSYRKQQKANGRKVFEGITRMTFNRDTNGVIDFQWVRYMTQEEAAIVTEAYNSEQYARVTGDASDEGAAYDASAPEAQPVQAPAPAPVRTLAPQVQTPPPASSRPPSSRPQGSTFARPAPASPAPAGGTFGAPVQATQAQTTQVETTQAQTGAPRRRGRLPAPAPQAEVIPNGDASEDAAQFVSTADIMADLDNITIPD